MALGTEDVFLIKSGELYSTLQGWEDGEAKDLTLGTGTDEICVAEIEGAIDCEYLEFSTDWATDSEHYCIIRAANGYEYDPNDLTGANLVNTDNSYFIVMRSGTELRINNVGLLNWKNLLYKNTDTDLVVFNACVFKGSSASGVGSGLNADYSIVRNSLWIINKLNPGGHADEPFSFTLQNVTIYIPTNKGAWGEVGVHSCICSNVVVYRVDAQTTYGPFFSCTGDYNAQKAGSTSPPGVNSIETVTTASFEDFALGNYHLSSDSVLIGAGDNLYSTPYFVDDTDGDKRPSTGDWDIGFDHYISAGGGEITGSGAPQADTATSSGSGLRLVTGSGSTQAGKAASTGSGEVSGLITGSGNPQADTATSSGSGLREITGTGNTTADIATTVGTGLREITGSGSPQAETATSTGSGLRIIAGSGSQQSETATSSGTGDISGLITGSGATQAETATSTGSGIHEVTGSGSPQAEYATSTGVAIRVINGLGSPQADTATSSGLGVVGNAIVGSGAPQAETATSTGVGVRGITGAGSKQADTATSTGAGLRLISGSGSTQAETATSTGTGTTGNVVTGSGSTQAETATSSGSGLRLVTGSGSTQAETAISSGNGSISSIVTGSGETQAETATSNGVGLRVIIGSGSAQAETATSTGYESGSTYASCGGITVEAENNGIIVRDCG